MEYNKEFKQFNITQIKEGKWKWEVRRNISDELFGTIRWIHWHPRHAKNESHYRFYTERSIGMREKYFLDVKRILAWLRKSRSKMLREERERLRIENFVENASIEEQL